MLFSSLLTVAVVLASGATGANAQPPCKLHVKVLSAHMGSNTWFYSKDPFVSATFGKRICLTQVKQNSNKPVWNEDCGADALFPAGGDLQLSIFDKNLFRNEPMGTTTFKLPDTCPSGPCMPKVEQLIVGRAIVDVELCYDDGVVEVPSSCAEPEVDTQCEWYPTCLDKALPCGWSPYEYAVSYGFKYCSGFRANLSKFSNKGQLWVNSVMGCLQRIMVPLLPLPVPDNNPLLGRSLSCKEIRKSAFDSHPACYLNPSIDTTTSVCDIPQDWFVLLLTIREAIFPIQEEIVSQALATIAGCGKEIGGEAIALLRNEFMQLVRFDIEMSIEDLVAKATAAGQSYYSHVATNLRSAANVPEEGVVLQVSSIVPKQGFITVDVVVASDEANRGVAAQIVVKLKTGSLDIGAAVVGVSQLPATAARFDPAQGASGLDESVVTEAGVDELAPTSTQQQDDAAVLPWMIATGVASAMAVTSTVVSKVLLKRRHAAPVGREQTGVFSINPMAISV